MKKQFAILVVTAILLVLGWTVIEYLLQSQIQYQYNQLTTYPVLVYSWDEPLLTNLQSRLKTMPYVHHYDYKSSETASAELIQKYNLQGAEDILQDKSLPNVILIYLKGDSDARRNKLVLKGLLEKPEYKANAMVEYQNAIWDKTWERIDQLVQIRLIVMAFLALVIFLVFVFKRLHYEHRLARLRHLHRPSAVEEISGHDHFWQNSLLLVALPVGLAFVLYELAYNSDWLLYGISWYFFLFELAVLAVATLTAYPFVIKYRHEEPLPQESVA